VSVVLTENIYYKICIIAEIYSINKFVLSAILHTKTGKKLKMKVIKIFKCNTVMILLVYFLLSFTLVQFSYENI